MGYEYEKQGGMGSAGPHDDYELHNRIQAYEDWIDSVESMKNTAIEKLNKQISSILKIVPELGEYVKIPVDWTPESVKNTVRLLKVFELGYEERLKFKTSDGKISSIIEDIENIGKGF